MGVAKALGAAALATGLVLGSTAAGWADDEGSGAASERPRSATEPDRARSVTLLTGDRVWLTADGSGHGVDPGPGREDVRFVVQRFGEGVYVIPEDARPLIAAGRLDRRLFDVATLLDEGFGDADRGSIPVIMTEQGAGFRGLLNDQLDVTRELPSVDGAALAVAKDQAAGVWSRLSAGAGARTLSGGVGTVWLDGRREPLLDESVPQIGAPTAWESGLTGDGVTVAVVDTGIDASHPDLEVAAARNFTEGDDGDAVGHGTHVASTIAGSGEASGGADGYRGVAPDARLLDAKVCDSIGCSDSAIIAGMEWAVEQGAAVVNVSLGGRDTPQRDPVEVAVDELSEEHDALFVVSAGNAGADRSISSPASADSALAVGAVDKSDELADFSSRGPRLGDAGMKPEITGPGVEIVAARAAGTTLEAPVNENYVSASGTSMAAPHVAGAAAIVAQGQPDWTGDQVKAALIASADPHEELSAYEQGAGRVDVARAVDQPVVAEPAAIGMGVQRWPHDDDEPVRRSITYHNHGAQPITLELSARVHGPGGQPVDERFLTLDADELTIASGESAQLGVRADTSLGGPDGWYSGAIVASDGETVVQTPFGIEQEVESYDLDLSVTGFDGQPSNALVDIWSADPQVWEWMEVAEQASVRLPKGEYVVAAQITAGPDSGHDMALLADAGLELNAPAEVELDARAAEPMSVRLPKEDATAALFDVSFERDMGDSGLSYSLAANHPGSLYTAQLGDPVPSEEFRSSWGGQWGQAGTDDAARSPYWYALRWSEQGAFPTGFDTTVRDSDLATVQAEHVADGTDAAATKYMGGAAPSEASWWMVGAQIDLPSTRTERYMPGMRWVADLAELGEGAEEDPWALEESWLYSPERTFEPGTKRTERWGAAVRSPSLPGGEGYAAVERGDGTIWASVPMYTDQAGHAGSALVDAGSTRLYRDGELVGESDVDGLGQFEVPAEPARYRLETSTDRSSMATYSTYQEAAWEFDSAATDEGEWEPLPLSVVRFDPLVDARNRAPAGTVSLLPVRVVPQAGSDAGEVAELSVEVSYDEGEAWEEVPVIEDGDDRYANVPHPADASTVSLRATATDTSGNSVEQTVIRAYGLR